MNKHVLSALLCPLLGVAAQAQELTGASRNADGMVGAYQPAPTDMPLVQDAKAFVQKHLSSMALNEVTEAYTQVVAGLNVKFVCGVTAEDGPADWQFVAYRSLDGVWHFYSANRI